MAILYYIHDPMCSWCYAFDKVLRQLETNLPQSIKLEKIVGGLAADSTTPMPESLAKMIQANWHKIEQTVPHVQFNFDFWTNNQPIRSTYPSCRAVLAAKKQSVDFENKMIHQIQWAYYQNAENPSLDTTLINCAKQIDLDEQLFTSDYKSQAINDQLLQQINFVNSLGISTYPSLCLEVGGHFFILNIDYIDANNVIKQIDQAIKVDKLNA